MTRLTNVAWLAAFAALGGGAAACGEPRSWVQLTVVGTDEGRALEAGYGGVEVGEELLVYSAIVRIERAVLETADESVASSTPLNVDLRTSAILLEEEIAGSTLSSVRLEIVPPSSGGVVPGEAISVYVAGVWDDVQFEYRDAGMEPLVASGPLDLDGALRASVRFDLSRWFFELDEDVLSKTDGRYLIDSTHNGSVAARIEAAIRGSVSLGRGAP